MTATYPPDSDNVVRYVGGSKINEGNRIDGSAFLRRPIDDGLSVNWLEFFSGLDKQQQIGEVRRLIHLSNLGATAVFAELNVGDVKQRLRDELPDVYVVNKPQPAGDDFPEPDPSHCEIMGLPPAEAESLALAEVEPELTIGDIIAQRVKAIYPAVP